jgi:monofunctional biosynthetic peptidoglycan transglycosylase
VPTADRLGPATPLAVRRRRWPRTAARAAEIAVVLAAVGALGLWCSVPDTAPLADRNPSSTAFIDLRRSQAEDAGRPFTLHWQWRPIGGISRYLRAAVIYAEDYNFYRHDGVDWHAIEHAVSADWNKGAMSIGGSTITQQLAKNLYLSPRRSVVRKGREVLIAFALEDHLSKQRLLELYLNVVEWGDGVFGAEAAAQHWFHHSAQTLSPAEAVRLAVALPNPIKRAPNVRDPDLTRKSVRLIRLLRMQGLINAAQERTALDGVGASGDQVLPDREVSALRAAVRSEDDAPRPASPPATEPAPASPATGEAAAPAPAPEAPPSDDTAAPSTEPAPSPEPAKTAPSPGEPGGERSPEPQPSPPPAASGSNG